MNMAKNMYINKQTKSSIKTTCAIIAFLGVALIASSCGTPGSARSKSRQSAKKSEQAQKNTASNDAISDFEAKINNKKAKSNDTQSDEAESLSQQFDASRKRMPTLREQINELGARQEGLETKVNTIEKDVAEIKNSVDVIKEQMNGPRRSAPIAGVKNNSSTMASDENSNDYAPSAIERDDSPAPAPKAKVATNSGAKKKSVTLKKPQKTNKKSTKKKVAANKPAPAETKKVDKPKKDIAKPAEKRKEDNSAPTGNLTQAMRYFGAKNYNKAIAELNTAVQNTADPSMINSCNYWLGESYFGLGNFDKSVPYFKKVINSASQQKKAEAYAMLAEAYMRVGQVESAKREFSALIEKYPKSQYVPRAKKMLQQL